MKVVLIGAGNLATHLGQTLKDAGVEVGQVYSRTETSAQLLANRLDCRWTIRTEEIVEGADYYIFSVKDSVLEQLVVDICCRIKQGIFAHTAGSIPCDVFKDKVEYYGVIYPLQTFSKARSIDFKDVPVFIEGNNVNVTHQLKALVRLLSSRIYPLTSEARQYLHLAAVWSCNFANHCYAIANEVLAQQQIPFEVLLPLINETTRKLNELQPKEAQTGPAVRYDKNVIEKQILLMQDNPLWVALYEQFSCSIYTMSSSKTK